MATTCNIYCEFKVVFCSAWGTLTDSDLIECQRQLRDDPGFRPDMNQLFDLSGVQRVELTSSGIRTLADRNLCGAGAKRAFCVEPGAMAMFGMARMFQILTDKYPDELRVQFDNLESARSWLGLPESS